MFILFGAHSLMYSQKYSVEIFNTDNGLPQNSVKDIIKDKYGFIWLTTENGIVRFDGGNFLVYNELPLNNQRFTFFYGNIEKDSILTAAGYGTVLVCKRTAKVLTYSNSSRKKKLYYLNSNYHPSQGVPFFITMKKGYYLINNNEVTYKSYSSQKKINIGIRTIYKNTLTVFASDKYLYHIDHVTKKILKIENGKVIGRYNVPLLADINSRVIWSKINKSIFIVNDNNIYDCSERSGVFKITKITNISFIKNINSKVLTCIYYDRVYNKLYLGTSNEGLIVLNFHTFDIAKKAINKADIFYASLP